MRRDLEKLQRLSSGVCVEVHNLVTDEIELVIPEVRQNIGEKRKFDKISVESVVENIVSAVHKKTKIKIEKISSALEEAQDLNQCLVIMSNNRVGHQ